MYSDNGTDVYDSGEKQRIPAWTGKWLLIDLMCFADVQTGSCSVVIK